MRRRQARAYELGFDVGVIFQKLMAGDYDTPELILTANRAMVRALAADHKLDVVFEKAGETRSYATFTPQQRLKLIEGGKRG